MAEKSMNNFKTAVNELMNGKLKTDETFSGSSNPTEPESIINPNSFRTNTPSFTTPIVTATSELSVFASDLVIEGTVKSKSDIRLSGYIKGDVSCGGSINSTGTIDGNIDGTNVTLIGSTINGNINVNGSVAIDMGSSVIGDISATSLVSDGKIKGNVVLRETISLQSNASVMGNVKAKNISIETGTTLVGNIEIKSTSEAPPAFEASKPATAPVASSASAQPSVSPSPVVAAPEPAAPASPVSDLLTKKEALRESLIKKGSETE